MDRTPAPTEDRTSSPTQDITPSPTQDKTSSPTVDKTSSPTVDETSAPSSDETSAPTVGPTFSADEHSLVKKVHNGSGPNEKKSAHGTRRLAAQPTDVDHYSGRFLRGSKTSTRKSNDLSDVDPESSEDIESPDHDSPDTSGNTPPPSPAMVLRTYAPTLVPTPLPTSATFAPTAFEYELKTYNPTEEEPHTFNPTFLYLNPSNSPMTITSNPTPGNFHPTFSPTEESVQNVLQNDVIAQPVEPNVNEPQVLDQDKIVPLP
jgi:hypothetical protein